MLWSRTMNYESYRPGLRGSALVLVEDQRAALAAVLVLQEMGFSVDIAGQPEAALSWMRAARYDWVVCSGGGEHSRSAEFAMKLRYNAPQSRILVLGGFDTPPDGLGELGVQVMRAPVNVNMLVGCFAEAA
jgi:DNA-binding response OmpR family regulator